MAATDLITSFVDLPPSSEASPPVGEELREAAFNFEPHWRGQPLEGFTMARQALVAELMGRRIGPSPTSANEAFMPEVWAVLWLCTRKPEAWRLVRNHHALLWEIIEEWAEEGCPRSEWAAGIQLVFGQRHEPEKTDEDGNVIAPDVPYVMGLWDAAKAGIVAVKRKPGPDLSGNVLSR